MKQQKSLLFIAAVTSISLLTGCGAADAYNSSQVTLEESLVYNGAKAPATKTKELLSADSEAYITEEEAIEIALKHAELEEADVIFLHVELDVDDDKAEYEIEFYYENAEYDYDIDAVTGKIVSFDAEAEYDFSEKGIAGSDAQAYISMKEAKEIAISDAGFSEKEISKLRIKFEWEDGKAVYEIKFYHGKTKYEYNIDAVSGDIISYEEDND